MADSPPSGWDDIPTKGVAAPTSPAAGAPPPGWDEDISEEQYGTFPQQALAAVEGVARGASLGTSDFLASRFTSPEAVKGRMEENPLTSTVFNIGGAGLLLYGTGGLAAPAEAALVARGVGSVAARVAGMTAEGAVFGGANAVSDAALGDPELNAGKVMAHVGMGAALGGGFGLLSKGIEAVPAMLRASRAVGSPPVSAPSAGPGIQPVLAVEMRGVQPTSFEEMAKRVDDAVKYGGETIERPQASVLDDALSRVEMSHPVHPLQRGALVDQEAQNLYNVARELPGKDGAAIRGMETLQKNELVSKTARSIDDLSPGLKPTEDAVEGGNRAIKVFTDQYQVEKQMLGPLFDSLKSTDMGVNISHMPAVILKMTDAVPGVSRMFKTVKGKMTVLPYKTSWGIDKATYNAVKEASSSLSGPLKSFEDLVNIRRGLDQHVDVMAQGPAAGQIRALKASMMEYTQGILDNSPGAFEMRDIFKKYAINEQQREVIEKVFGASVGNKDFGAYSKIKPEVIGDRIFSNTASVKAAKDILDPKDFNHILANWLSEAKAKVTDKGAFSSNKFGTFLKKNQDALNVAFEGNPGALIRLNDLTSIMRILPDGPSINPSGTAKTIYSALQDSHSIYDVFKKTVGFTKEKLIEGQTKRDVGAALAGKSDRSSKLKSIEGLVNKVGDKIKSGAKAIFDGPSVRGGGVSGAASITTEEYDKQVERIKKLSNDPHAMMDHMSGSTESLYSAAPNITQGIHNAMVAGVSFLNSKIPVPSEEMVLSHKWEPSKSQRYKFENYYRTVNDPVSVLTDVRNNSVTGEALEALNAVHPALLQEMRSRVMEHLKPEESKKLSYASKMSIAKFLGQPLDQNMLPQMVMANQAALNAPELGQQSAPQSGAKAGRGSMKNLRLSSRSKTRTAGESDNAV